MDMYKRFRLDANDARIDVIIFKQDAGSPYLAQYMAYALNGTGNPVSRGEIHSNSADNALRDCKREMRKYYGPLTQAEIPAAAAGLI